MELWKYYRILRKRKWLIIIGTLICVGIVLAATHMSRPKYEAYTTITETAPDQLDVNIFGANYSAYDPKLQMANLAQMVRSREVLENTVSRIKSEVGHNISPDVILNTLKVIPVGDTSMLAIQVQSTSSNDAQLVADIVTKEFIKFYNQMNYGGPAKSRIFIEDELPKAQARLDKVRKELRTYKEQSGAVSLNDQASLMFQQLLQFQSSAAQNDIAIRSAQAKLASLDHEMKRFPETRTASTVIASNPLWQQLQSSLATLEVGLEGMKKTRTKDHPEVMALQKQVDETRLKLKDTATTILNSTTETVDPIRDGLVQQYALAYVERASAQAASNGINQVLASLQPQLKLLPEKQMRLAQLTLEEEAEKSTYTLLRQKYVEAKIKEKEANNLGRIQIVDTAQVRPADSKRNLKLILAILLAPIFCSGIALLLNYLDNTVRTPSEAEDLLKLPVFAVVPIAKSHLLASGKHLPAIDASYQMLSTNLLVGQHDLDGHCILVASAEPDVGRSVTAANLAITLAKDGARVILVDSDLRQPALHNLFGVDDDKGLSNVLAGQLSMEDALRPTKIKDLLMITSGPLPSNPVRLLRSESMAKFVSTVNDLADFVVFDSPAGITFPDSSLLAALVKNVVIVHAAGIVPRGAEDEFRVRLDQVGANQLGVVLNMVRPEDSHGYYHFRSAYEELMKNNKASMPTSVNALNSLSNEDEEETDKV